MDWNTFFASLITSVGGIVGVSLIFLRFCKKRVETYIDDAVNYRFNKKIEEYKQSLNKQFSSYETFYRKYNDCVEIVVKQLSETVSYLKVIQVGLIKCVNEHLTLHYLLNQNDQLHSFTELCNVSKEMDSTRMMYRICLPNHIADGVEDILGLINEYTVGIKKEIPNLQVNMELFQRLLNTGNTIQNNVNTLSEHIREESLRRSGEL